jgi:hypothetical protein
MNIGSRSNIEPGGVAALTNAMATYVRHLVGASAGHGYRHIDAPKMPMATPVAATSASDSITLISMQGCFSAPNRSPGAGVAAQIP